MPLRHFPVTASPDDIAAAISEDGAAIIDNVVKPEVMDRIATELEPWLSTAEHCIDDTSGRRTRRLGGLIARSTTCRDLVMNPLILSTVQKVVHLASSIQLHLTQLIAIDPGEKAQIIHRDQSGLDLFPFPKDYQVECNTIWAMTDFTDANGATRIIPGSHFHDEDLDFTKKQSDTIPAEMAKGSVLLYTGSVYHGGGANRSDGTRIGINLMYSAAWVRQEENQFLSVPLDVARTLPLDLLKMLGYARAANGLGYIDDMRDPIEAIHPEMVSKKELGDPQDLAKQIAKMKAYLASPRIP